MAKKRLTWAERKAGQDAAAAKFWAAQEARDPNQSGFSPEQQAAGAAREAELLAEQQARVAAGGPKFLVPEVEARNFMGGHRD
jgi:hypothetical protein